MRRRHLGGAIAGFYFIRHPHHLHGFFDFLGWADPTSHHYRHKGQERDSRRPPKTADRAEVDRILDKISDERPAQPLGEGEAGPARGLEQVDASTAALHRRCDASKAPTGARVGRVETPHGAFDTPAFMPVGSRGAVKGVTAAQLRACGAQIVLANAYHLLLRPGVDVVRGLGGLHRFMGWDGPILTDSGGYQVFSLSHINRIDDDGVTFRSIVDGSPVRLGPERAMEVQNDLGADIIMAFDDCPPSVDPALLAGHRQRRGGGPGGGDRPPASAEDHRRRLEAAHERTLRWLERCQAAHARPDEQALFGIVQGGPDLSPARLVGRGRSAAWTCPGYAIGGVAVGEGPELIERVVRFTAPLLPEDRPRYLMGVGYERDLLVPRSGRAWTCSTACCPLETAATPTRSAATAAFSFETPASATTAG